MKKILIIFIFCFLSCKNSKKPEVSFYYWKTIFRLSDSEKIILNENQVKKIYIRYFDVNFNPNSPIVFPESPIVFESKTTDFEIVPVIFIKNKVWLNQNLNIQDLAQKAFKYLEQINNKNHISCQEIQLDCDWSLMTKDKYLQFVSFFKKISGKKLSATIRLHQIKYFLKTKIPNVDKGVLMYYNMGKIGTDSQNSIYDKKIADKYLGSLKKYPLSLNVALPIYSWGIHIQDNKVLELKSKIDVLEFKKDTNFVEIKSHFFRAKADVYKNGIFYKTNDFLKIESITKDNLLEMTDDLSYNLAKMPEEIIFYDLDEFNTKQYEKNIFTQIINRF